MERRQLHRLSITLFVLLGIALVALAIADMLIGTESIPVSEIVSSLWGDASEEHATIIYKLRMPKVIVAIVAGMALSASGLLMQTLFRNPLAGPYVLGINSGASFAVALFTLAVPMMTAEMSWLYNIGVTGVALIGSAAILFMVMALSRRMKSISVILILGMMLGSAISAVVGILQYMGTEESLKAFMVWTMGSLGSVSREQLLIMAPVMILGLALSVSLIKPLNAMLLGENYASTMGINIRRTRLMISAITVMLAGTVTAFCGPIGFIGLAVPHIARMTFREADHRVMMPASMLLGALIMLFCDVASQLPANDMTLPINTVTALIGIPVVVVVIVRNHKSFS